MSTKWCGESINRPFYRCRKFGWRAKNGHLEPDRERKNRHIPPEAAAFSCIRRNSYGQVNQHAHPGLRFRRQWRGARRVVSTVFRTLVCCLYNLILILSALVTVFLLQLAVCRDTYEKQEFLHSSSEFQGLIAEYKEKFLQKQPMRRIGNNGLFRILVKSKIRGNLLFFSKAFFRWNETLLQFSIT